MGEGELVSGVMGLEVHHIYGNTYLPTRSSTSALRMQPCSAIRAAKGETEKRGINQESGLAAVHTTFRRRQQDGAQREPDNSYLHKAQWQECHVVGTEERVEENFLDPAVEVCF